MQKKHIILAVVALAGLAGGAWNWLNYFKQHAAPPVNLEVVRQPSKVEQEFQAEQAAAATAAPAGGPPAATAAAPGAPVALNVPSSLARNPFLTLDEEKALAHGELLEPALPDAAPVVVDEGPPPPEIPVKGVIQDNVTGKFMALIEGRYYGVGDRIGEEKVVGLDMNTMTLESGNGSTRRIPLNATAQDTSARQPVIRIRKAP
ncbi:hypothetical protein LLH00_08470 [bacterium]|nr:hypothetical protein [bacterium]